MNATWTVKVERMQIRLPVGIYADELEPQTVWVSLMADGVASASPQFLDQCFDYEPLCHWLTNVWPRTPHTPLLETRINELLGFVFSMDERLETAWVGLYKQRMSGQAVAVGIERRVTRAEFFTEQQTAALPVTQPVAKLSKKHERNPHAAILS